MKKIIVANWKMNPKSLLEAEQLLDSLKESVRESRNIEIVVCPPFVWLEKFLSQIGSKKSLILGAQNCHWESHGAFTGEVSAAMLADLGVEYAIIGHSERRQYLGESDSIINAKARAALKAKIKPIICVGERQNEEMHLVVENQVRSALNGIPASQLKEIIIAYEPVWAIGPGDPCSPDSALSANLFIKKILTKLYNRTSAEKIAILYGGSVDQKNAADYVNRSQMAGLLVGGASLDAEDFREIIRRADLA